MTEQKYPLPCSQQMDRWLVSPESWLFLYCFLSWSFLNGYFPAGWNILHNKFSTFDSMSFWLLEAPIYPLTLRSPKLYFINLSPLVTSLTHQQRYNTVTFKSQQENPRNKPLENTQTKRWHLNNDWVFPKQRQWLHATRNKGQWSMASAILHKLLFNWTPPNQQFST